MLLADSMNGRNQDGEYSNIAAANVSINCADDKPRYTTADVQAKLPEFREASPSSATIWRGGWSAAPTGPWRAPPTTRT